MSSEADRDAEALVRRFIELSWNQGDEVGSASLLGPGFAHHDLVTHAETDATGYLNSILRLRAAFSSIRFLIHDAISAGGRVATRWTVIGGHAATGETVDVAGLSIDRVRDDRIVENWTAWDLTGLDRQVPGLLRGEGPG